jgi:hypothetical protein
MAGRVRQPINVGALEKWISKHVPEIEVPLDVKQVIQEGPSAACRRQHAHHADF